MSVPTWDLAQDGSTYVEAVHRLNNLGAVVTHVTWKLTRASTPSGGKSSFSRSKVTSQPLRVVRRGRPRRRGHEVRSAKPAGTAAGEHRNACIRALYSYVAVGDWHAVAQITADNVSVNDRRRVVNAEVLHGRDADIEDAQATADVGFTMTMVGAIATRGERLALLRVRVSGRDPEAIRNDALDVVEIDADERIVGDVVFDLEDFDSAIAELDARYIVGEAAALCAHVGGHHGRPRCAHGTSSR